MNFRLLVEIKKKFGTQTNFAHKIGIDRATLSQMVNGWRRPTIAQREKIAMALNLSADELFERANETSYTC